MGSEMCIRDRGRGAARTGRPAGRPARVHSCGGRQRERPRHAAKGRCGRCDGQRHAGDPGAGAPCQQGRLRPRRRGRDTGSPWHLIQFLQQFSSIFTGFCPDFSGHSSFLCNVYKLLCKTLCLLSITKDGLFVYTSIISAYGGIAPAGANPTHRESSNIKGEMRYESHRRKGLSDRHYPCYRFQQR